jgi:hypothetical protein
MYRLLCQLVSRLARLHRRGHGDQRGGCKRGIEEEDAPMKVAIALAKGDEGGDKASIRGPSPNACHRTVPL